MKKRNPRAKPVIEAVRFLFQFSLMMEQATSRDKGNAMPSSLTTNRVKKTTLTVFINFQKETKLQTVNPLTLAQMI